MAAMRGEASTEPRIEAEAKKLSCPTEQRAAEVVTTVQPPSCRPTLALSFDSPLLSGDVPRRKSLGQRPIGRIQGQDPRGDLNGFSITHSRSRCPQGALLASGLPCREGIPDPDELGLVDILKVVRRKRCEGHSG